MRFRAKAVDVNCIHHFTSVVNTVGKLLKKCALRLTTEKIFFILPEQVSNGGVSMWCELKQAYFFDEYQMDGVNKEHNEIFLEITLENLCRALKSAQNAKSLKIKLTKKQTACLTVEIELPSLNSASRVVTHDIPVWVVPCRLWNEYDEQEMPDFQVSVCLPPLKTLKNIGERLKNLSSFVTISTSQQGDMTMTVHTELVSASTRHPDWQYVLSLITQTLSRTIFEQQAWFQNLEVLHPDDVSKQNSSSWPPDAIASARVDIRKFLQFLSGQQINPYKVICNILHETAIHLFLVRDGASLQYFIPTVAS